MAALGRLTAMRSLVAAVALCITATAAADAGVLKVGDRMVELDVAVDAAGKPFRLKAFKGQWLLVTVGAAWCKPCKKELPTWDKLAPEVADKITFVALGLDDEIDTGKEFHKKLKLQHMKLGYMPSDKSGVAARYGASTMPSTFIIDPNGVVKYVRDGFDERDPDGERQKMKAAILKLIP
jgi:peroxiredoxin